MKKSRNTEKTVRTKLMTIPIVLIIVSVLIMNGSVAKGTAESMMDEMREETQFLLANIVHRMEDFERLDANIDRDDWYQSLMLELEGNDEIDYAGYMGRDYKYIANSDEDFIGNDLSGNERVVQAVNESLVLDERVQSDRGGQILDMVYPVIINGENRGALKIGRTLDDVVAGIISNFIRISITGLIIIAIISIFLYLVTKEIIYILSSLSADVEMMARGDFSADVPQEMLAKKDEFGVIASSNMTMKESIRSILADIRGRAEGVASYSEELSATANNSEKSADELSHVIQEIAEVAVSQAEDVDEGLNIIEELESVIELDDTNIGKLNDSVKTVDVLKDEGLELIKDLVDKTEVTSRSVNEISDIINETSTSAENIVSVIEMIKSISEQTNLLALNASIEAARAGEAGRGFAVVASEISSLAEESNNFTKEIEEIVKDLTNKTLSAVDTMGSVNNIVNEQNASVSRTDAKFQGISQSLEEIYGALEEVNSSSQGIEIQKERLARLVENLASTSQENAAGTEEATASVEEQNAVMGEIANASEDLAEIAEAVNEAVSIFKI